MALICDLNLVTDKKISIQCSHFHKSILLGELHGISVAAVQRTLRSCPVLGFIFGPYGMNDEPCRQVKALCHFCLTRPTSWNNIHTPTS